MRVARYSDTTGPRVACDHGSGWRDAGTDPLNPKPSDVAVDLTDKRLLAPIDSPRSVLCIGLNYRDHAAEAGQPVPESPMLFAKLPSSVTGPGAPISVPSFTEKVDYEAELAVVIGTTARRVSEADALNYVFGYTCANDVSARDLQFTDGQWTRGKSLDTFCPLGPWIVTREDVPDPQNLAISCTVNGHTRQSSNTSQMVFSVAKLISYISRGVTLSPGDILLTGTPPGVGVAQDPPVLLRDGDHVEVAVSGVGTLKNPVTSADTA